MQVQATELPGVLIVTPRVFEDSRGFFMESWNKRALAEAGVTVDFVQDNHSLSRPLGTLRGLHFQAPPAAQAKLVRVLRGRIWDVAVDLRPRSATFGRHVAVELSADNRAQLFIPTGFAHGFITLEPETEVAYKASAYYAPDCDGGLIWNDPDLGIPWPLPPGGPVLSAKDQALPPRAAWANCFAEDEAGAAAGTGAGDQTTPSPG